MAVKVLCEHCGASMMENKYTLNMALVRALAKLKANPNKLIREIGLTKVEYSVHSKLKYWGFTTKLEDGNWIIMDTGIKFLSGKLKVPREITYFRNRLMRTSGEFVSVWDVLPTEESKQKYREMMSPHISL